ncbi:hypothetical protein TRICI_004418 [Trichomonascus ciferrii]|uniref:Uncharacterized protein n=1 Tax=Trichomonascus ciferrii TaxID=44093 RepID=A0A642V2A3_9ASCO|nr:hypothetical protein TRICI_004418 [Trichomonascus ciferrii]
MGMSNVSGMQSKHSSLPGIAKSRAVPTALPSPDPATVNKLYSTVQQTKDTPTHQTPLQEKETQTNSQRNQYYPAEKSN